MANAGYPQNQIAYLRQLGASDAQLSAVASGSINSADLINLLSSGVSTAGTDPSGVVFVSASGPGGGGSGSSGAGSGGVPKLPSFSLPWWAWLGAGAVAIVLVRHI